MTVCIRLDTFCDDGLNYHHLFSTFWCHERKLSSLLFNAESGILKYQPHFLGRFSCKAATCKCNQYSKALGLNSATYMYWLCKFFHWSQHGFLHKITSWATGWNSLSYYSDCVLCFLLVLHIGKIVKTSDKRINLITWINFYFIFETF